MLTREQIDACVAFTAALQAAGLFGEGGAVLDLDLLAHQSWPPSPAATWSASATNEQRARYAEILAGWDWTDTGTAAAKKSVAKVRARAILADMADPTATAARNADRALFRSLVQTRNTVNQVIDAVNALPQRVGATPIPRLTNRTFAQAMLGAAALVDAETGPEGD